ncbi:MAG: hypothetical protein ACKO8Q_00090 [Bacteroidota bacterium]
MRKKKALLHCGVGYSAMNFFMNQGPLKDSSVSLIGYTTPSINGALEFSLTKKRNKWKQNLGVFCTRQAGHINSSNYTWHDSLNTVINETELNWKLIKNTFGIRYTFVWKIPIGKKGDLGYSLMKKLHVSRSNGIVYSGVSASYNMYESMISTANPNFQNNNFKLRSFDGQIILLGITGFKPRSGLGFNMECAIGGPYFVKAGLVFSI